MHVRTYACVWNCYVSGSALCCFTGHQSVHLFMLGGFRELLREKSETVDIWFCGLMETEKEKILLLKLYRFVQQVSTYVHTYLLCTAHYCIVFFLSLTVCTWGVVLL